MKSNFASTCTWHTLICSDTVLKEIDAYSEQFNLKNYGSNS